MGFPPPAVSTIRSINNTNHILRQAAWSAFFFLGLAGDLRFRYSCFVANSLEFTEEKWIALEISTS